MPSRSGTPGAKLHSTASAAAASCPNSSRPRGAFRFSVIASLAELIMAYGSESLRARSVSPRRFSTLMTRAPDMASKNPAYGPW